MKAYWTEVSNFSSCRGLKLLGFFIPHMWVCESYICLQYVLFRDFFLQLGHCHNLVTHSCFCLQVVSLLPIFSFPRWRVRFSYLKPALSPEKIADHFWHKAIMPFSLHSVSMASHLNVRHILMVGGGLNKCSGFKFYKGFGPKSQRQCLL